MEEKKAERAAIEVDERLRLRTYLATFVEQHVEARQLRSAPELHQVMRDYILPALGEKPLPSITKGEIVALLDRVSKHSRSAANKVFDWLRTMMNFARSRGDLEVSPLDNLSKPHKTNTRDRVLTDKELQRVWEAAHDMGFPLGVYIMMLILTAQRANEVRGMRWEEIDLGRRVWVIPKDRSKNKRAHLVPLTSTILHLFDTYWPVETRRGALFKNSKGKANTSGGHQKDRLDLAVAIRTRLAAEAAGEEFEQIPDFQLHDIRRSVATGLQRLGTPVEHTEAVLNHISGTRSHLVDIYQLYKYEKEKRRALDKWHAHIEQLMDQAGAWPGGRPLARIGGKLTAQ